MSCVSLYLRDHIIRLCMRTASRSVASECSNIQQKLKRKDVKMQSVFFETYVAQCLRLGGMLDVELERSKQWVAQLQARCHENLAFIFEPTQFSRDEVFHSPELEWMHMKKTQLEHWRHGFWCNHLN